MKILRPINVAFTALIQILIYWCVIVPTLTSFGVVSTTPSWVILCAIAATALICAGGYVINDYFDVKIDRINRPDRVIVTNTMSKAEAMRLYQIVTGVGIVCGLISAFYLRSITLGMIYVIVPGMLWFYSSSYKRQLIVGNLIVALSAGLVPLVPMFVEASSLSNKYGELLTQTPILRTLYGWVCAFALFSFLFTFIREAIKDLQDEPGDREYECHTMAVVWGETITRIVLTALIIFTNAILAYFVYALIPFEGTLTSRYFLFGIAAPSICLIAILWSKSCTAYANASSLCKFIMLIGTLYALIYHYLLAATYHIPMFGIFQIMQ